MRHISKSYRTLIPLLQNYALDTATLIFRKPFPFWNTSLKRTSLPIAVYVCCHYIIALGPSLPIIYDVCLPKGRPNATII